MIRGQIKGRLLSVETDFVGHILRASYLSLAQIFMWPTNETSMRATVYYNVEFVSDRQVLRILRILVFKGFYNHQPFH
jgi:hypothetical protein